MKTIGLMGNTMFSASDDEYTEAMKKHKYIRHETLAEKHIREQVEKLNDGQKKAYNLAMEGKSLILTGSGGVGKTYTSKLIIEALQNVQHKNVAVLATTGCASHIIEGVTVHKYFRLKADVQFTEEGNHIIHCDKKLVGTDCIYIDEVSMLRLDCADTVFASIIKANAERKKLRKEPIQLILSMDMFQLPPVVTEDDKERLDEEYGKDIGKGYFFQGDFYEDFDFTAVELTEVVRQSDKEMISALNRVRKGDSKAYMWFNDHMENQFIEGAPTIFPFNRQVKAYNLKKLYELKGDIYDLPVILPDDKGTVSQVEEMTHNSLLQLKRGARIMFTTNAYKSADFLGDDFHYECDPSHIFINGTFGWVRDIEIDESNHTRDRIFIQTDAGHYVYLYRKRYDVYKYITTDSGKPVKVIDWIYNQFPISLAWSVSVHKSQGQSYKDGVNISTAGAFDYGLAYVALSRSGGRFHLVDYLRPEDIMADPTIVEWYEKILN